jgi:hypothetical protein
MLLVLVLVARLSDWDPDDIEILIDGMNVKRCTSYLEIFINFIVFFIECGVHRS